MDLYNSLVFRPSLMLGCLVDAWRTLVPALFLSLLSTVAQAVDISGSLSSDLEYSNNVRQSSTDTQEDIIHRAGVGLSLLEERKNVRADANVQLDHEHYYNDSYEDETSLRSGFGLFSIDLVEEFFNWQATFSRTDVLSDSSDEENPDTREYRNILRTGPSFSYAISRTMNLSVSANYTHVENSSESAVDSERADGSGRFSYLINSQTDFLLSARHEQTLESDDNEKLKSSNISAGFVRRFNRGLLRFNYGVQAVDSNILIGEESDDTDSNFFDISLTKERFLGHSFVLSYLEELSDTAIGFQSDESSRQETELAVTNERTNSVAQTDIEKRKQTSLTIRRDTVEYSYDISSTYEESQFRRAGTSERYRNLIIGIQPKVYAQLVPRFEHGYTRENFSRASEGEDVVRSYALSAVYQLVPDLFLNTFLRFEKTDNDERADRESEDFMAGLGINWIFL